MADLNLEAIHHRGDGDKHLGDGIFAPPPADDASRERSDPPRPLRLVMTYGKWKTRGDVEAIPIAVRGDDDVDNAYAGWEVRRHPRIERRPVEVVRRRGEADDGDADDAVLAVIDVAPNANEKGSIVVRSPRPRFEGQMPAGGLYPWAVVTERPTKGNYFKYATEVRTISREAAATRMEMNRADDDDDDGEAAASSPHAPSYTVEDVPGPTGPRTVVRRNGRPAAAMEESYGPSGTTTVTATVAPGIDPCLIVCLAVDRTNRLCIHNRKRSEEECFGEICVCFCCPCL